MEGMASLMRIPFARRGWFSGANSIRLREGDRLNANSIRLERLTLWVRNRSLWRGWRNWCEFHSLVKIGILWRNPIPYWGNPLEENTILLEEGAPLKRILFVMDRGRPRGEYDSLGEGNPLEGGKPLAGDYHSLGGDAPKATPIRCGEGRLLRRYAFTWWNWEEGHLDRADSSMKRILFALWTETLMLQSPTSASVDEGDLVHANSIWFLWNSRHRRMEFL